MRKSKSPFADDERPAQMIEKAKEKSKIERVKEKYVL